MKIRLRPIPPFSLDLSAGLFRDGDPAVRGFEGGEFHRVINLPSGPALIRLRSEGSVEEPCLSLHLLPDDGLTAEDAAGAGRAVSRIFNLDVDLNLFYGAVARDPIMSAIARQLPGLKSPASETAFEALISSIIEQQISIIVARRLQTRLCRAFGDAILVDGGAYYAFPKPSRLASASVDDIKACGMSARKAEYIRGAAEAVAGGLDIEGLRGRKEEEIMEVLCAIRGIGRWTAEFTMIRGLSKLDVLPADDLGIRRCISRYYCSGREVTAQEARRVAEGWRPWRGLAGYYLLTAERMGVGGRS